MFNAIKRGVMKRLIVTALNVGTANITCRLLPRIWHQWEADPEKPTPPQGLVITTIHTFLPPRIPGHTSLYPTFSLLQSVSNSGHSVLPITGSASPVPASASPVAAQSWQCQSVPVMAVPVQCQSRQCQSCHPAQPWGPRSSLLSNVQSSGDWNTEPEIRTAGCDIFSRLYYQIYFKILNIERGWSTNNVVAE